MKGIFGFARHLIAAMFKGFVFAGILAAIICGVALYFTAPGHNLTMDTSAVFAIVIALMAGVLGALVALIYHLTHMDSVHAMARRYGESHAAQHR